MIKNIITKLCVPFCIVCFIACEKQTEEVPDIKIGKENSIDELSLNKQMEKRVILSGGNGKYIVNIENKRIATAQVSVDTLKVQGVFEGETFATIISHDKHVILKINVVVPELGVSHKTLELRPGIRSKMAGISGGGERVTLQENDPADIMDVKWDGSTGILEINPKYEGEAEIIAISENGKETQTIQVKVRPEGELKITGWYTTTGSSYYEKLGNQMIVKRRGVGTWIVNSARPYGDQRLGYGSALIKLGSIVDPTQGDSIDLNVLRYEERKPQITKGTHRIYVEEVRETEVLLRGRGFKFLLPYEK